MSSIHEILIQKKTLHRWASAVIHHDNWQEFAAFAKAHVMDTCTLNGEAQRGIQLFMHALNELTDTEKEDPAVKPFGLNHQVDDTTPKGRLTTNDSTEKE